MKNLRIAIKNDVMRDLFGSLVVVVCVRNRDDENSGLGLYDRFVLAFCVEKWFLENLTLVPAPL